MRGGQERVDTFRARMEATGQENTAVMLEQDCGSGARTRGQVLPHGDETIGHSHGSGTMTSSSCTTTRIVQSMHETDARVLLSGLHDASFLIRPCAALRLQHTNRPGPVGPFIVIVIMSFHTQNKEQQQLCE